MTSPNEEGTPITKAVPDEVELREIGLSFMLPEGKNLSRTWQRELRTQSRCRVRLLVSREGLELSCSPPILIDAQWPAMNMELGGGKIHFEDARIEVFVSPISGPVEGLIDYTSDARGEVSALLSAGIAGTAMAAVGYDAMNDARLLETLEAIADNFRKTPSSGASDVSSRDFDDPAVFVKLASRAAFVHESGGAGLSLSAGGVLDIRVQGSGDLAEITAQTTTRERLLSARLESITIETGDLLVIAGGKPLAKLDRVRIDRGGAVALERMRLLGSLDEAAGMESLVRIVAKAAGLHESGAAIGDAAAFAAQSPDVIAQIVPGLARGKIEEALTEGVRALVRERAYAIPGYDLREILGT